MGFETKERKHRHIALVGVRIGDEGKGAREIYYAKRAASRALEWGLNVSEAVLCDRWHGGAGAGHTATLNGRSYKFHLVPAGVIIEGVYNLEGSGMLINPRKNMQEIERLRKEGLEISPNNLGIASNAFVTFQFHVDEDQKNLQKKDHTSTGNGNLQTAADKYARNGVRFAEFLDPQICAEILKEKKFPDGQVPLEKGPVGIKEFIESYVMEREFLAPFMVAQADVFRNRGKLYRIGEGAHGGDIDVEEGLYPGTVSSHPLQVPGRPDLILGVTKMYDSSVGSDRPFVGRLVDANLESRLREFWGERGTTTGKDRKIGWLDLVAMRHAIEVAGVDYLVGNCGDRMEIFAPLGISPKLIVGYKINGRTYDRWDVSFHNRATLYRAEPVLEEFKPWNKFVGNNGEPTPNAQRFLDRIQEFTGKQFALLGTGPGEDQVIEYVDVLEED